MFVGINFQHKSLSRHVLCRARHLWSGGVTRPTPLRPKVYENRNARGIYDFVEKSPIHLQRFIDRGKRSLTRTATPRVSEVICSNTIFLATLFTCPDCRHFITP